MEAVGSNFDKVDRIHERTQSSRHYRKNKCPLNCDTFLDLLNEKLENDIANTPNYIRIAIASMRKKDLRQVASQLRESLCDSGEDFQYTQWYLMTCDAIESKIYKPQ